MKATCLQENIKQALQITNRFTPGRTSLPIIQSTLIQAEGGMLRLEIWPESGVGRPAAILGVNKHSEG